MRPRHGSTTSSPEELASMYDYLAKVILLGPSGCGKSCLLHRVIKNEWRILSSQTIGVEFASKIIKIGTGARRKRVKLQLWDTAGTERFRSLSRSYYRGAAGAILVYDLSSRDSFVALPTFLNDARALASSNLTVLLAGNKSDLTCGNHEDSIATDALHLTPPSTSSRHSTHSSGSRKRKDSSSQATVAVNPTAHQTVTATADQGRQVGREEAAGWASKSSIPVSEEVSAYTGEGVEELFSRLARIILAKIETGEIDPDDPLSGIQYGDNGGWTDDVSIRSGTTTGDGGARRGRGRGRGSGWRAGMWEWRAVFRTGNVGSRDGCC